MKESILNYENSINTQRKSLEKRDDFSFVQGGDSVNKDYSSIMTSV